MRVRPSILIGLAVIIGLLAAAIVVRVILSGDKKVTKSIVVAVQEIAPGRRIAPGQVKSIGWFADDLPAGAFQKDADVIGRVAKVPIIPGEPVLALHLARPDSQSGLPAMIADGKRAISIGADEVTGVAGFAMPGNYVDVLVSAKDNQGVPFSRIVLEGVKILAVKQQTKANPDEPVVVNAVTLEMTPAEAEKLDLARSVGALSLVLRPEFDRNPSGARGARLPDLFTGSSIVFTAPEPRQPAGVGPVPATAPTSAAAPVQGAAAAKVRSTVGGASFSGNAFSVEEIRGISRGREAQ